MDELTGEPLSADPRFKWSGLSQAEKDAAYNNNNAVKESAALIEERNMLSARSRAAPTAKLDIPYAAKDRTKIDLYPAAKVNAPCFVFIHGGYWQRNSRDLFAMLADGFAAHGWSVAIPGYTLAPEASLTEIVDEIRLFLDWLQTAGPSHGIAGPVVVSGWSAGGHLAALALDHPVVTAGLAISGVYDLGPIRDTYLNTALHLSDDEVSRLSPLKLPAVQKRLAIAYGAEELPALVWDSRYLAELRREANASTSLHAVEGANHFSILNELRLPHGKLVKIALDLVQT